MTPSAIQSTSNSLTGVLNSTNTLTKSLISVAARKTMTVTSSIADAAGSVRAMQKYNEEKEKEMEEQMRAMEERNEKRRELKERQAKEKENRREKKMHERTNSYFTKL